jgi:hypothetical protein
VKFALHGIDTGSTVKPDALALVARKAEQLGYAPGCVPRSRFDSDLFPALARFADDVIARL